MNQGISSYFALPENVPQASAVPGECPMNSLVKDKYTLFMDELETIYKEGRLVDGVCGRALALDDGEVAPLGINLDSTIDSGTVEFWFRPDSAFYTSNTRTLLGNDGARIHFLYKNGELVFQKNQSNKHIFVKGKAEFKSGWNLIAGQWDGHTLSLWLNGEEVAQTESASVYEPSNRNGAYGNILLIGFKSSCCMEAIDVGAGLTTSGAYDQVRVSSVPRYSAQK